VGQLGQIFTTSSKRIQGQHWKTPLPHPSPETAQLNCKSCPGCKPQPRGVAPDISTAGSENGLYRRWTHTPELRVAGVPSSSVQTRVKPAPTGPTRFLLHQLNEQQPHSAPKWERLRGDIGTALIFPLQEQFLARGEPPAPSLKKHTAP